jgi:hypothetical protein
MVSIIERGIIVPEYISGRPISMQVLIENMLIDAGVIKLVKDGGATGSLRFTRDYKVYHKGKATDIRIRFTYNKRDNWADMAITYEHLTELKAIQMLGGDNVGIQVHEVGGNKSLRAGDEETRGIDGGKKPNWFPDRVQASQRETG